MATQSVKWMNVLFISVLDWTQDVLGYVDVTRLPGFELWSFSDGSGFSGCCGTHAPHTDCLFFAIVFDKCYEEKDASISPFYHCFVGENFNKLAKIGGFAAIFARSGSPFKRLGLRDFCF